MIMPCPVPCHRPRLSQSRILSPTDQRMLLQLGNDQTSSLPPTLPLYLPHRLPCLWSLPDYRPVSFLCHLWTTCSFLPPSPAGRATAGQHPLHHPLTVIGTAKLGSNTSPFICQQLPLLPACCVRFSRAYFSHLRDCSGGSHAALHRWT